jgi:hypothetical protein
VLRGRVGVCDALEYRGHARPARLATVFATRGAPLRLTTATRAPSSRCARSPGLAIVAEQQMKTGSEP